MKFVLIALLFGVASCGRLDSQYLPPGQQGAGGYQGGQHGGGGFQGGHLGGGGGFQGGHLGGSGGAGFQGNYHRSPENDVPILRLENNNNGDGSYNFNYETGNGIQAHETGYLKNAGTDGEAQTVQGSYSYTGPDGKLITVSYTADENGFHAEGDHLPTPPPIPEAILKSIEFNQREEQNIQRHGGDHGQQSFSPQTGYNY